VREGERGRGALGNPAGGFCHLSISLSPVHAPEKDATDPRPGSGMFRTRLPLSSDRSSRTEHTLRSQHTTSASPAKADAHCSRSSGCSGMTTSQEEGGEGVAMSVRRRLKGGRKERERGAAGGEAERT